MPTLAPAPKLPRKPVDSPLPELAARGGSAQDLAHDARNFLSAVNVYSELLAAPGVLAPGFRHYASDLRQLGQTGASLLDQLAGTLAPRFAGRPPAGPAPHAESVVVAAGHPFPPIDDLAASCSPSSPRCGRWPGPACGSKSNAPRAPGN